MFLIGFVAGLVSFPLVLWTLARLGAFKPEDAAVVSTEEEISQLINGFYRNARENKLVFLNEETQLEARVNKLKSTRRSEPSLHLEIRFNDSTRNLFDSVARVLADSDVLYSVKRTPKKQLPSRVRVSYKSAGIYAIPQLVLILDRIFIAVSKTASYSTLVDSRDVYQWGNNPER